MKLANNPLVQLANLGQSVWLDFIERRLLDSGDLEKLVDQDDLRGLTSNPAIFEKAIAESQDYARDIARLALEHEGDARSVYEALAVKDIQDTCDILGTVYRKTKKRDGYASLEVSPRLAHDTAGTIAEARRLWAAVNRPNLMVKVPGTPEGIPAIRQLIEDGININVTLLFSEQVYAEVAEAYLQGLEARARSGRAVDHVASVASFFISRIDTLIDGWLDEMKGKDGLRGKAAIANAKRTYQRYVAIHGGERWSALSVKGAQTQRLLWASTSTKNPSYRDVVYVEELVGPDTVNTIPPATLAAFRDHGIAKRTIDVDLAKADKELADLAAAGVSLERATAELLADGLAKFVDPFDKLLAAVTRRAREAEVPARKHPGTRSLPAALEADVVARLDAWQADGGTKRLFARDASLWTSKDEASWLGWLDAVDASRAALDDLARLGAEIRAEGITHALLLGMGGSSLGPEVLSETFGRVPGAPELLILDSTDPTQVRAIEARIDISRTVFIVSSKSGGTLETASFHAHFFARAQAVLGSEAGRRFIAITDPGSKLEAQAKKDGFRLVVSGVPSIGGRFSMLSPFGLVPAAVMGLDVRRLMARADRMARACKPDVAAHENPGLVLGTVLGRLATHGKNKLTLVSSPGLNAFGAWIEQLVAESTGKEGKAIIPVDREALGPPNVYGNDRVFVYSRLDDGAHAYQDAAIAALEKAGHPVVRISVPSIQDVAAEMYRWEIATAIASVELKINPFDQPDVESAKIETKKLMSEFEATGALAKATPFATDRAMSFFSAPGAYEAGNLDSILRAHLAKLGSGDYLGILAYLPMTPVHDAQLQRIRHRIRDGRSVATCLGFGPRFLHSTGQAYKGGPDSGVFVVLSADHPLDVAVPGTKYTFGVAQLAQARGDTAVLVARGRRVLHIHLGGDVQAGLAALERSLSR